MIKIFKKRELSDENNLENFTTPAPVLISAVIRIAAGLSSRLKEPVTDGTAQHGGAVSILSVCSSGGSLLIPTTNPVW